MKTGLALALALFAFAAPALAQNVQSADTIGDIADKALAQDAARAKQAPAAAANTVAAAPDAAERAGDETVPASSGTNVSVDISPGAAAKWFGLGLGGLIVVGMIIAAIGLAFYFIPTFVALARKKRNTGAIFAVNLFLGWSFVGWILALVWAVSGD